MAGAVARFARAGWVPQVRQTLVGTVSLGIGSVSNALLLLSVLREGDRGASGSLVLTLMGYSLLVGSFRVLVGEEVIGDSPESRRQAALGDAAMLGVIGGALVLSIALAMDGTSRIPLLWIGLFLPALIVQDACRYLLMARDRFVAAMGIDLVWMGIQILALALGALMGSMQVHQIVGTWVLGGFVSACAGLVLLRHSANSLLFGNLVLVAAWKRRQASLWEFAWTTGSSAMIALILSLIAGPGSVAVWRAGLS